MFEQEEFPIVTKSTLSVIGKSHTLRCDAKQRERRFIELDEMFSGLDCFFLGEYLPVPLLKGSQPTYLDTQDGIPVINTLSIQKLRINQEDCRYISEESYEVLPDKKKLKENDVLLTMDGGTSIGKPVLFDLEGEWTVDSHVAILRPKGISPKSLVYLLASPIGQVQFQKAESGASGQTAVTEECLRRFVFPMNTLKNIESLTHTLDIQRIAIQSEIDKLQKKERIAWEVFTKGLIG